MIWIGTSGYNYPEWKGSFYPEKLPAAKMLPYYAERFPTVEINNTFYRMPKESVVLEWGDRTPPEFRFALKASQKITHFKRLKDAGDELSYFLRVSSALAERLGPTLFQLPPNMKKDLPRLEEFLGLLPKRWRATFEFRHQSWFDDAVYQALKARNAALCIADGEDLETPLVTTADWGYVRLHRPSYDSPALTSWAKRLREQVWSEAYVFFKHEGEGSGPPVAEAFLRMTR
jgi:uncharacterized protein YecE (DUF72 family)